MNQDEAYKYKVFWAMVNELLPIKNKYIILGLFFIILFIAVSLPIENYYGITPKSRSDLLGVKHRILFDIAFLLTLLINLYMWVKFYLYGLPQWIGRSLLKFSIQAKENNTPDSRKKASIVISFLSFVSFLGVFLIPPSTSPKYQWMNQGNIYIDCLFIYLLCIGFMLLNISSIASIELIKNDK